MKSMNRHMGKVDFKENPEPDADTAAASSGTGKASPAEG
jgi:hypothetical protein